MNDLVSRELAVNMFKPWLEKEGYTERELNLIGAVIYGLKHLPPVQPKRGKWIEDDAYSTYKFRCSECGCHHRALYDFCPSCGAEMRGE